MLPKKRRFDYSEWEEIKDDTEPLDLTVGEKRREPSTHRVTNTPRQSNPSPCPHNRFWNIPIMPPQPVYSLHEERTRKSRLREICKRPMNAFMIFSKKHRSIVLERNPGRGNRDISKILSDCWYSLRPEERKHYDEFALELKIAHHEHCRSVLKRSREEERVLTSSDIVYLRGSSAPKDRERISILETGEYRDKFSALPVFDVSPGKCDRSPGIVGTVFFPPDFNSEEIDFGREEPARTPDSADGRTIHEQRSHLILQLFQQEGFFPSDESVSQFQTRYPHIFPKRTGLQAKIRVMRQKLMACKTPSPTA